MHLLRSMSFSIQALKAGQIYKEWKAGACNSRCQAALLPVEVAFQSVTCGSTATGGFVLVPLGPLVSQ